MAGAKCCTMLTFCRSDRGLLHHFLNPRLNEKPGDVHLYCTLMACGDCGSTTPSKADCRIPKQSNIRRAIGEHEKCNRKQQQDSGCGFRRQKRRLAIPFVFDKQ